MRCALARRPTSQGRHPASPNSVVTQPSGQLAHAVRPASEKNPGAQSRHVYAPDWRCAHVPAAHVEQRWRHPSAL